MNDPATCRHSRAQLIAKDSDAEYVECLDCGAIIDSGERTETPSGFDESLSDAQGQPRAKELLKLSPQRTQITENID